MADTLTPQGVDPEQLPPELRDFVLRTGGEARVAGVSLNDRQLRIGGCFVFNLDHPSSRYQAALLGWKVTPLVSSGGVCTIVRDIRWMKDQLGPLQRAAPPPGFMRAWFYAGEWTGFFHVDLGKSGMVINVSGYGRCPDPAPAGELI